MRRRWGVWDEVHVRYTFINCVPLRHTYTMIELPFSL